MHDEHDIEIDDDDAVLVDGAVITQAPVPAIVTEEDFDELFGEDEDIEDLGDDLELELGDDPLAAPPALAFAPVAEDPRVAELAATVDTLKAAAVSNEQRRVRSKVKAATGGAGLAGLIPIVLQLAGAVNLDPEVASAIVGGVAVLGAFVAGWVTPERQSAIVAEALSGK